MARKFSKTKLDTFRSLFVEKRKALIDKIRRDSDSELDIDGDDVDRTQGNILSEQAALISKREVALLQRIEDSIKKIDDGTFGACEECESRIGEKRLTAIPGCKLCISCAEEQERYEKQYGKAV